MAHPRLTRRTDRRALLAAGAASALLATPVLATPADGATGLLDVGSDAPTCDVGGLIDPDCGEPGPLSPATALLPDALSGVSDPVETVVDDVLRAQPEAGPDHQAVPSPAGDVTAVEDVGAIEDVASGAVERIVGGAVDGIVGGVVGEVVGGVVGEVVGEVVDGVGVPANPGGVLGDGDRVAPAAEVGTAASPLTPRPSVGPPQGPGTVTPPFATRGDRRDTTVTPPSLPFVPPATAPLFGNVPQIAERFLSRAPQAGGDALSALHSATTTVPGPDAPSWLLATATGMLLLLGAGHLVHARHRYTASVAR